MRVLIVCSGNSGAASPFVQEQADHLSKAGCVIDFFLIRGKGWLGYLRNRRSLLKKIAEMRPDIVHAHSGMSALLSGLQRKVPVVATFHGSDVNVSKLRFFTRAAIRLSRAQIVVSNDLKRILGRSSLKVIPCAVDDTVFHAMSYKDCRSQLGWGSTTRYIVFSSSFQNAIKNPALAKAAVESLHDSTIQLMELRGKSRKEVACMLNACDVALLTSFSEGSPQFIKEAMACQTPVVSTRVGDVPELFDGVEGHYLADANAEDIASKLLNAISFRKQRGSTKGYDVLVSRGLLPSNVTREIIDVYNQVLNS